MKKSLSNTIKIAVGTGLLASSVTTQAAVYYNNTYINGSTYTPKFPLCTLLEVYSQDEVLFRCTQTNPAGNMGTGTLEFQTSGTYNGVYYDCQGTVPAHGTQQTYWVIESC